ncbi:hypothetical protein D3C80_1314470 [compost metagenome]
MLRITTEQTAAIDVKELLFHAKNAARIIPKYKIPDFFRCDVPTSMQKEKAAKFPRLFLWLKIPCQAPAYSPPTDIPYSGTIKHIRRHAISIAIIVLLISDTASFISLTLIYVHIKK